VLSGAMENERRKEVILNYQRRAVKRGARARNSKLCLAIHPDRGAEPGTREVKNGAGTALTLWLGRRKNDRSKSGGAVALLGPTD